MPRKRKSSKKGLAPASKKTKTRVKRKGPAIVGGQNDVNTSEANAVVRLDGCTGTLIKRDLVLTAGHCISHALRSPYDVAGLTSHMGKLYAATRDDNLIVKEIFPSWRDVGHARGVVAMTSYRDKLYATTADFNLVTRGISEQDERWVDIGHARGVVAMTSYRDKLYAATADGNLVTRGISGIEETWVDIGHARGVVGLAAAGGDKLFVATRDNNLSVRRISEQEETWRRIGHANQVVAMTSTNDPDSSMLYIITSNGKVWKRQPVEYNEDWQHVDRLAVRAGFTQVVPPAGVVSIAVADGKLYAATTAHTLHARYLESDWRRIGHARGVVAMTAGGDNLFVATRDSNLSVRRISEQDEPWRRIGVGQAQGVVAITSFQNKIFAAKADGNLVTRTISEQVETWDNIGHAQGVVTMTAGSLTGGIPKLYAAKTDGNLVTRYISEREEPWRRIGHAAGPAGLAFMGNKLFLVTTDKHLSIRDTVEREINWDYAEPDREFAPRIPGKWNDLPSQIVVNFGNNSQAFTHRINAIQYCIAGFADIILLKLVNPVPDSTAIPMRVLSLTPDGVANPSEFWRGEEFKLVGWGGGATIRQTTTARNGRFPGQGMHGPVLMNLQNVTGGTQPGDSGSPLIWGNPPCVIGVCQTSGAQYFTTFSNGGTDSLGLVNPNIGEWIRQFA